MEVAVTIGKDGSVTDARGPRRKPESDSPFSKALEEAAIEAAKQWRFAPDPNGPITTTYTLSLTLGSAAPRKEANALRNNDG